MWKTTLGINWEYFFVRSWSGRGVLAETWYSTTDRQPFGKLRQKQGSQKTDEKQVENRLKNTRTKKCSNCRVLFHVINYTYSIFQILISRQFAYMSQYLYLFSCTKILWQFRDLWQLNYLNGVNSSRKYIIWDINFYQSALGMRRNVLAWFLDWRGNLKEFIAHLAPVDMIKPVLYGLLESVYTKMCRRTGEGEEAYPWPVIVSLYSLDFYTLVCHVIFIISFGHLCSSSYLGGAYFPAITLHAIYQLRMRCLHVPHGYVLFGPLPPYPY